jgi:hypothetical protein
MVTALFDRRSAAENAIRRLVNAGVPQDRICLMPGDASDASDDAGASSRPEPRGFWGSLGDWLLPDEDRHIYAEGLSRGGYLISVTTGDEHYARVMAIQGRRSGSWRVDETYVRVGGRWRYLFRAIDKHGQLIASMLFNRRDTGAAYRFLRKALRAMSDYPPHPSRPTNWLRIRTQSGACRMKGCCRKMSSIGRQST